MIFVLISLAPPMAENNSTTAPLRTHTSELKEFVAVAPATPFRRNKQCCVMVQGLLSVDLKGLNHR